LCLGAGGAPPPRTHIPLLITERSHLAAGQQKKPPQTRGLRLAWRRLISDDVGGLESLGTLFNGELHLLALL
jgi:hypothetical protein